jgi:hypothetical protein
MLILSLPYNSYLGIIQVQEVSARVSIKVTCDTQSHPHPHTHTHPTHTHTLFYTLLLKTVCRCAHYTLLKKFTFCFLSTNQLYAVHFDILNNELDNMIESDMYWYNAVPEQIHRYNHVQV